MKQTKLHWFLIDQNIAEGEITLTDKETLHQFNKVLKFKEGENVVLFDGKGTYSECKITGLKKQGCVLQVLSVKHREKDVGKIVNLFFALPKKNKFEFILEKGSEVSVSSFTPLITDRTEKLKINRERANKILVEASEQSENPTLPLLNDVQSFKKVIQNLNSKNTFVFHTNGESLNMTALKHFSEVNLLIGPEGGWSEEEIRIFKDKEFQIYKAGESVLKTETACIVIPFLFSLN